LQALFTEVPREGAGESRRTLSGTVVLSREYHSRSSERALTGLRHPALLSIQKLWSCCGNGALIEGRSSRELADSLVHCMTVGSHTVTPSEWFPSPPSQAAPRVRVAAGAGASRTSAGLDTSAAGRRPASSPPNYASCHRLVHRQEDGPRGNDYDRLNPQGGSAI